MISSLWKWAKKKAFISGQVDLGTRFHLGMFSYVSSPKSLRIGNDVYIGKFCSIQCSGEIGDGVLIANNVGIIGRKDHDFRQIGVPVRHSTWVGNNPNLASSPSNRIVIGSDVWIGYGAVILSGITIGKGAIVAAGSVVISDIEPYSIVAGNPAKIIGTRFDGFQIVEHELIMGKPCND